MERCLGLDHALIHGEDGFRNFTWIGLFRVGMSWHFLPPNAHAEACVVGDGGQKDSLPETAEDGTGFTILSTLQRCFSGRAYQRCQMICTWHVTRFVIP